MAKILADRPDDDVPESEVYSELAKWDSDDDVWNWCERAIKSIAGQVIADL